MNDLTTEPDAEETLRASDARFRLLVDQLPFSLQIVDPAGRTVRVNRAWEKLWGVTLEGVAGYNLLQDQQLIEKGIMPYILRAFAGEAAEVPAVPYVPDRGDYQGQERWTRTIVYPVLNEDRSLREVVLIHEDITARRQAEERLRAAEVRQALLLKLLQGQRETSDPREMMAAAAAAVGRHLRANRIGFFEMVDHETLLFTISWTDGVLEPLSGTFPATGIGTGYLDEVRAGRTLGLADTSDDPLTADSMSPDIGARSVIGAPIIRNGSWHAGLYVHHSEVREWTEEEIGLVRIVADQTWDAVERARAQQALQDTQVRLEATLVASEIATWTWDIKNDRVVADQNLARMFSVAPEDAAGGRIESYFKAIHQDDAERVKKLLGKAMQEQSGQYETDYRLVQTDGSIRWVTARGKVERDDEGNAVRLPGVVMDITERKQAEEHVTYQKRLLEALTESVLDAILIVSPHGELIHFNRRFLEMWHFPPELVESRSDAAALDWAAKQTADPEAFLARVAAVYANPDTAIREEITLTDGRVYERFGSSIRSGDARLGYVWTFRDITQRRQSEEALREKEGFVRLLLDSAADAFYGVDRNGVTTFCNAAFLRLLGFDREEEAIGKKLHDVIHHSHPDGSRYGNHECHIYRTAQTGQPAHIVDEVFFRLDGSSFPVEYWAYPIVRDGELRGAVTTFIDITERREAEIALQRAKHEAEEANREKDRFLAMLSHELRTPLTPVLMTIAALRSDPNTSEALHADLELIRRNVELETLLIDDLLDLTRIAHGKFELRQEAVDVHTAIEQALRISGAELEKKALKVTKQFAAAENHCWADAARLQQVFWNIIKNAVKFTPVGGELRISTRNDHAHRLVIDFIDTGIGIALELQARIFDAFEQGSRSVTAKYGGLGLGLAISKRVIDMHAGLISVHSEGRDRGATFSITLEAMQTSLLSGPAYPLQTRRRGTKGSSILLVEDHADTARVLQRVLEHSGYRVAHASTVAAAREHAAKSGFDLLISDVGLPDGTGVQLLSELRRDHDVPAIAISGFGMLSDVTASRAAGFAEHFTKPVDWEQLRDAIERLLATSEPTAVPRET